MMNITVQKFDPSVDTSSYLETYEVPYKKYITTLETIVYIHENHEPLAFEYSCRGRQCGRCAIMLDDVPSLACVATLDDTDHTIAPLTGFPVIRDLTVDRHALHENLSRLRKRIRTADITVDDILETVDPAAYGKVDPLEWCARCGICNASCPALNIEGGKSQYIGPAGMIAIAHRYYDPYDQGDRILQAVSEGMYHCIMCGKCDEVCNSLEVKHIATWTELRDAAAKAGYAPA
jgi:fumarate reductase iron-sulfur subunit/fumarate reductase (CoM/CoB) subunit B